MLAIKVSRTHVVQFVVESARVADRFSVVVPPPKGRGGGLAVGAYGALTAGCRLKSNISINKIFFFIIQALSHRSPLWLHKGPVCSIHLVIESTGIAEVVPVPVPSPKGCRGRATVDTLSAL